MTVGEMLSKMSNREFLEWYAYYGQKAAKERLAARKG